MTNRLVVRRLGLADYQPVWHAMQDFTDRRDGETQEGFVMRTESGWVAYRNWCPHWGVDLDMGEGRFFSALTGRIFCSSHGALFSVRTGYCEAGPCVGDSLEQFGVRREGDRAIVTIDDEDPHPW